MGRKYKFTDQSRLYFVSESLEYLYSSAKGYSGGKGLPKIICFLKDCLIQAGVLLRKTQVGTLQDSKSQVRFAKLATEDVYLPPSYSLD